VNRQNLTPVVYLAGKALAETMRDAMRRDFLSDRDREDIEITEIADFAAKLAVATCTAIDRLLDDLSEKARLETTPVEQEDDDVQY
jgi:hypothetical protein